MKRVRTILLCLPAGLGLVVGANAAAATPSSNPYQQISEANVFRLRPPQVHPVEPARPPLPRVTLTGIVTMGSHKRALLKVQWPDHPPEPAKEESYLLAEGQQEGPIEILSIDEKRERVEVSVAGSELEVTFDRTGGA
jgi:hypothetical protein